MFLSLDNLMFLLEELRIEGNLDTSSSDRFGISVTSYESGFGDKQITSRQKSTA